MNLVVKYFNIILIIKRLSRENKATSPLEPFESQLVR